jgi:8-oxo-dGTP pyrophosphatase MutT (NUDIX family)
MNSTDVRDDQLPSGAGDAVEVPAVPAATTIVLRGDPFEVLMMRRHLKSTFVPGAWVFPGGVLEKEDVEVGRDLFGEDAIEEHGLRLCAVRELFEESGIWIGSQLPDAADLRRRLLASAATVRDLADVSKPRLDDLVLTARWITPIGVPKRFDTWFFLVMAKHDEVATPEMSEGTEILWIRPDEALVRHRTGELTMVFPTLKNLEAIASFSSAETLIASRRATEVRVTRPILVVDGDRKRIILPEEIP